MHVSNCATSRSVDSSCSNNTIPISPILPSLLSVHGAESFPLLIHMQLLWCQIVLYVSLTVPLFFKPLILPFLLPYRINIFLPRRPPPQPKYINLPTKHTSWFYLFHCTQIRHLVAVAMFQPVTIAWNWFLAEYLATWLCWRRPSCWWDHAGQFTARCQAKRDTMALKAVDWAWGSHHRLVKHQ